MLPCGCFRLVCGRGWKLGIEQLRPVPPPTPTAYSRLGSQPGIETVGSRCCYNHASPVSPAVANRSTNSLGAWPDPQHNARLAAHSYIHTHTYMRHVQTGAEHVGSAGRSTGFETVCIHLAWNLHAPCWECQPRAEQIAYGNSPCKRGWR